MQLVPGFGFRFRTVPFVIRCSYCVGTIIYEYGLTLYENFGYKA